MLTAPDKQLLIWQTLRKWHIYLLNIAHDTTLYVRSGVPVVQDPWVAEKDLDKPGEAGTDVGSILMRKELP